MRSVLALLAFVAVTGCNPPEDALVAKAKKAAADLLRDPSSAQFRDVEKCAGRPDMVMGQINGKNGYGAYDGYRPFFYHSSMAFMIGAFPFSASSAKDIGYFSRLTDICFKGGDPSLEKFYSLAPAADGDRSPK